MSGSALPDNVLEIINAAVTQAVQQTREVMEAAPPPRMQAASKKNYFVIMEKLLFNYPRIKRIIEDKAGYTKIDVQERSKSIVGFTLNATRKAREDILDEMERDKESEYNKTVKQFREVERVIQQFEEDKRFIVVRLYYFNEGINGTPRPPSAPPVTWEDVSIDIARDVKTVRRWRQTIVSDMATCLFGINAAME